MKRVFVLSFVTFCFGILAVVLWPGSAYAPPPGCSPVAQNLAMCQGNLTVCEDDLAACEADCQIFPGDGQLGDPLEFGLPDHGPALSYTENSNGTFSDDNTGYMWEEKTGTPVTPLICTDATVCPDPHNVNNEYTWSLCDGPAGEDHCPPNGTLFTLFLDQLNNACDGDPTISCSSDADYGADGPCGLAGFEDWCIPNVKRLQSIVDYKRVSPASSLPGTTSFPFYWSSTTFANNTDRAWDVRFSTGVVDNMPKSSSFFVRAVRPCL